MVGIASWAGHNAGVTNVGKVPALYNTGGLGDIKTHPHVFEQGTSSYLPCLLVASVSPRST